MSRRKTPEPIISKLRKAEVALTPGETVGRFVAVLVEPYTFNRAELLPLPERIWLKWEIPDKTIARENSASVASDRSPAEADSRSAAQTVRRYSSAAS